MDFINLTIKRETTYTTKLETLLIGSALFSGPEGMISVTLSQATIEMVLHTIVNEVEDKARENLQGLSQGFADACNLIRQA